MGVATTGRGAAAPYRPALALLATLFFMWGFISVINNTLLPHLRSVFELNYLADHADRIDLVHRLSRRLDPSAAKLIERIGYQRALTTGLMVMTAGSLGMILAASLPSYGVTLASLFTVSCGIALLQVAANPYVAVIGPPETSESRLTLVQAFNTTGDVLAIVFGRYLILARTTGGTSARGRPAQPRPAHGRRAGDRTALSDRRDRAGGAGDRHRARQAARARRRHAAAHRPKRARACRCGATATSSSAAARSPCACLSEIGVGNLFINFASQPSSRRTSRTSRPPSTSPSSGAG